MLTSKQLNVRIAGVRRSTKAFRANIQELLIECAAHAYCDGQTTPFKHLYDAANGADRLGMARWAKSYGFSIIKADGKVGLMRDAKAKADFADGDALIAYLTAVDPATQQLANCELWFDMGNTTAKIAQDVDLAASLIALAKKMTKAKEAGKQVIAERVAVTAALKLVQEAV